MQATILDQHITVIAERLTSNDKRLRTVKLKAPFASGKTTYIPVHLTKYFDHIIVVMPSSDAMHNAHSYVQRKNPMLKVGFAFGGDIDYPDVLSLSYVTVKHIKRRLLSITNDASLLRNDHILYIVDEAHLQTNTYNLVISLLVAREIQLRELGPCFRLMMMSANTIPYLELLKSYEIVSPPAFHIETMHATHDITNPAEIAALVTDEKLLSKTVRKNVLIFVSGIHLGSIIVDILLKKGIRAILYYSGAPDAVRKEIFDVTGPPKCVVTTNVLEIGSTIPDVSFVIDTMTEKLAYAEVDITSIKTLKVSQISHDSMSQRRARTGRTCDGLYYTCIDKTKFMKLIPTIRAEITRVSPYNELLELISAGQSVSVLLKKPDPKTLALMMTYLTTIGLYIAPTVQFPGVVAAYCGTSCQVSMLLWKWAERRYPIYWGVVIAALLDAELGDLFEIKGTKMTPDQVSTKFAEFLAPSQFETLLKLWLQFEHDTDTEYSRKKDWYYIRQWAGKKQIKDETWQRTMQQFLVLIHYVQQLGLKPEFPGFRLQRVVPATLEQILRWLQPIIHEVYGHARISRVQKAGDNYKSLDYMLDGKYYTLNNYIPVNNVKPDALYLLRTVVNERQKGTVNLIVALSLSAPRQLLPDEKIPVEDPLQVELTDLPLPPLTMKWQDWYRTAEEVGYERIFIPPGLIPAVCIPDRNVRLNFVTPVTYTADYILSVPKGLIFNTFTTDLLMIDDDKEVELLPKFFQLSIPKGMDDFDALDLAVELI
jgi:hypothetical protein